MGFQKIIHISDIHIRAGDTKVSRYDEYSLQIDRLLEALGRFDETECVVVLTGDIFHEKYHIGPSGQLLAKRLFRGLSRFTTLVIKGNHDYRQDQKDEPDMLKPYFDDMPENLHYLEDTDLYEFENIEFGVVAIEETLNNAAKGGNCARPAFPCPSPKSDTIEYRIALFHGSAGGAILQNGTNVDDRGDNISVRGWIPKEYDAILLGDIHVQQVHCVKPAEGTEFLDRTKKTMYISGRYKMDPSQSPWGYSGSLIQQNMGESLWGHGFIVWDLEEKEITAYHVRNDYGKVSVTLDDKGEPCIKIRIGRKQYPLSIKTSISLGWFPTSIYLRFNMNAKHCVQDIQSQFEEAGIVVLSTGFMDEAISEDISAATSTETKHLIVNDLSSLNSPQEWSKFFVEKVNLEEGEWTQWLQSPNLMVVPVEHFPQEASLKIQERNTKFIKLTDSYYAERDMQPPTRRFRIHYLEFSWLLCFGQMNYINFDEFVKKVVNINGNNGSGKSSLLEIIAVAIYGESFPSRSAKSFTASIINQHIPKTETAYSKICFSIDGTKYWIHRTYDTQPNGNEKSLWQRIIRLLDNEGEIVKEKANAVDPWIEEHIGVYKHFLLTTIMSQFNDNDFFSLTPKDQKTIIDSLLHLNVCESFRLLLKEAQKNHEYALSQLTTYEAGLINSNSRFESHYGKETDIQAQLEQQNQLKQNLASLKIALQNERAHIMEFSEKAFQQPLSDYMTQKAQLQRLIESPLEGNYAELKVDKTNLRNQLAVLKSKKYPQQLQETAELLEDQTFESLENRLNELRIQRIKYGSKQRLYDSKAHKDWLKRYDAWLINKPETPDTDDSVHKLKTLFTSTKQSFSEYELDEDDFKPIPQEELHALEAAHNTIVKQLSQKEHEVKLKTKELVALVPSEEDQLSLDTYKAQLDNLTTTFGCDVNSAAERMMAAQPLSINIKHLQSELTQLTKDLQVVGTVRYEPKTCSACSENPYRHEKERLLKKQKQLDSDLTANQEQLSSLLQSERPYEYLKQLFDTFSKANTAKSQILLQNETKYKELNKALKLEKQALLKIKESLDQTDYETQKMVYEYYELKASLSGLQNQLTAATFKEEFQDYTQAKAVHDLEKELTATESLCKAAYAKEYQQCEQDLKQVEASLADHESYANAQANLAQIDAVIAAYPHYNTTKSLEEKYKQEDRAYSALSASITQQQQLRDKLDQGKSETERVSKFRTYLSQRGKTVNTMATAFEQFTDQLYPSKVGPSIETAVNTVLNSIALPRPIKLKAIWESGSFSWHLEDGISSPPYEKCAGAHRFFVGLAIRIAFSRMGASNMVNSQFFLDEGFTACDSETMERVPQLLKNLLKDLDYMQTIFIVSHLDTLKTAADESIMITRGAQASQLKVGDRLDTPKGHAKKLDVEDGGKKRGRPKKAITTA